MQKSTYHVKIRTYQAIQKPKKTTYLFRTGCGWKFKDTSLSWVAIQVLYVILLPVEYVVPAILVVASCAVSCLHLLTENPKLGKYNLYR